MTLQSSGLVRLRDNLELLYGNNIELDVAYLEH